MTTLPKINGSWKDWVLGVLTMGAIGWTTTVYADIQGLKKDISDKSVAMVKLQTEMKFLQKNLTNTSSNIAKLDVKIDKLVEKLDTVSSHSN